MSHSSSLGFSLCVVALFSLPAFSKEPNDAEQPIRSADELVALMAGGNLYWFSQSRAQTKNDVTRAAEELASLKDEAIPALTKGLESNDDTIRLNCVYVLRSIDTPASLALCVRAASDAHPKVRAMAVRFLPAYGDDEGRRAVIEALKDPDPEVRELAVEAFSPEHARRALERYWIALSSNQGTEHSCVESWRRLRRGYGGEMGGYGSGGLSESELKARASFIGTAIDCRRDATAVLLMPLLDDPRTQSAAARVLGDLGTSNAGRPLLALLDADDGRVRSAAISSLGKLKEKRFTVYILPALKDGDPSVRTAAAVALGEIGDMRATQGLIAGLSDEHAVFRMNCATALGKIGDHRAGEHLIALLDDPNGGIRTAAAEALGQIGDPNAVEALCAYLWNSRGSRDPNETWIAARALGQLRDPRSIDALQQYPFVTQADGKEICQALTQIRHPDAIAAIVKMCLETRNRNVHFCATSALRRLVGSFSVRPSKDEVAEWWESNREYYYRPEEDSD